jgi:hypothetical protein
MTNRLYNDEGQHSMGTDMPKIDFILNLTRHKQCKQRSIDASVPIKFCMVIKVDFMGPQDVIFTKK